MACNHCNIKFNFFHKELGCENCGLSFCSKCLKQKCAVPSKGNMELSVCKTCYVKLTTQKSATDERPPPDVFLKRLEALENPAAPPITIYKSDKKLISLRTGLSAADQQLLDRLEKLKDDGNMTPPTEDELRKRLNSLKGTSENTEGPSQPQNFIPDIRSDEEQVDSLLEQFMTERDINQDVQHGEKLHDCDEASECSEEEVNKITKKLTDEVNLEEKTSLLTKQNSIPQTMDIDDFEQRSSPELPWCVLCNKDATYRCLDCNDLYCSECNVEVHKSWGETGHTVVSYKKQ